MSNLNSCDGFFSAQIGEGEGRGGKEGHVNVSVSLSVHVCYGCP